MLTTERLAGSVLAALGLFVLEESWRHGLPLGTLRQPGPAYTPVVLALMLIVFGAGLVVVGGRAGRMGAVSWSGWRQAVAILGVTAFCALALERLGYRLTVATALLFLLAVVERKRPTFALGFAVVLSAASFFLFATVLRVPLPRGPWGL